MPLDSSVVQGRKILGRLFSGCLCFETSQLLWLCYLHLQLGPSLGKNMVIVFFLVYLPQNMSYLFDKQ